MKCTLLAIIAFVLLLNLYAAYAATGKQSKSLGKDSEANQFIQKGKFVKAKVQKYLAKKGKATKEKDSFTKTLQTLWNLSKKGKKIHEEGTLDAFPKGKIQAKAIWNQEKGKKLKAKGDKGQAETFTKGIASIWGKGKSAEKGKGKALAKGKASVHWKAKLKGAPLEKGGKPDTAQYDTKPTSEKPSTDDGSTTAANTPDYPQPVEPQPSLPAGIPDNILRDYAPDAIVDGLDNLMKRIANFFEEVNQEAAGSQITEPLPESPQDPFNGLMDYWKKFQEGNFSEDDLPGLRNTFKTLFTETKTNESDPRYAKIREELGDLGEYINVLGEGVDSESSATEKVQGVIDNFAESVQNWIQEKPENEENVNQLSQTVLDALEQFRTFIGQ